jgi:hypothetical protein
VKVEKIIGSWQMVASASQDINQSFQTSITTSNGETLTNG